MCNKVERQNKSLLKTSIEFDLVLGGKRLTKCVKIH